MELLANDNHKLIINKSEDVPVDFASYVIDSINDEYGLLPINTDRDTVEILFRKIKDSVNMPHSESDLDDPDYSLIYSIIEETYNRIRRKLIKVSGDIVKSNWFEAENGWYYRNCGESRANEIMCEYL